MALFRNAVTQEEQIEYALALRGSRRLDAALREEYFRWFVTPPRGVPGATPLSAPSTRSTRSGHNLSEDEKLALKPCSSCARNRGHPNAVLAARPLVKAWTVSELVPLVERGPERAAQSRARPSAVRRGGCAACHRFSDEGARSGPI
jgi:mono/diheme cytochrome c family protein